MKTPKHYKILLLVSILALSSAETKPMGFFESAKNYFLGSEQTTENEKKEENSDTESIIIEEIDNDNSDEITEENKQENQDQKTDEDQPETQDQTTNNQSSYWSWVKNYLPDKLNPFYSTAKKAEDVIDEAKQFTEKGNSFIAQISGLWAAFLNAGQAIKGYHPVLQYTPHALLGLAGLSFFKRPITSILLGLGTLAYFNANAIGKDIDAYKKNNSSNQDKTNEDQDQNNTNKTFKFTHTAEALKANQNSLALCLLGGLGFSLLKKVL